jgi:protein-histidine pros-kinase
MAATVPHHPAPRVWPTIAMLATAFCIVLAASWHAQRSLTLVAELTDGRAKARTGRLYLEQTLSLFKDLETGVRGFALTGEDSYLAPYEQARRMLPGMQALLKEKLEETHAAGGEWAVLEAQMQERMALLERLIEQRRGRGAELLGDAARLDPGRQSMDRLRLHFAALDRTFDARIEQMNQAVGAAREAARLRTFVAIGLTLLVIGVAIGLLLHERRRRLALETQLRQANADLDSRVAARTAELAEARDRIAAFAIEQERAIEAERRRLAREVHDQIGQVFTAIKLVAASLPREAFPPGQAAALAQALETGIVSTRRITAELRPPLLDDLGLAAALEHYAGNLAAQGGLQCTVALADADALDAEQALALFRIVQEAATNVLRHAAARRLEITGRAMPDAYLLTVADDGRGFVPAAVRPGALGLAGMRERARLLGGGCSIVARADAGTRVEVRLPRRKHGDRDESPAR